MLQNTKVFPRRLTLRFLTQPTISTHVSNLENELGVRLLNRSGRGDQPDPPWP